MRRESEYDAAMKAILEDFEKMHRALTDLQNALYLEPSVIDGAKRELAYARIALNALRGELDGLRAMRRRGWQGMIADRLRSWVRPHLPGRALHEKRDLDRPAGPWDYEDSHDYAARLAEKSRDARRIESLGDARGEQSGPIPRHLRGHEWARDDDGERQK